MLYFIQLELIYGASSLTKSSWVLVPVCLGLPVITTEILDDVTVLKPSSAVRIHVNVAWSATTRSDDTVISPSIQGKQIILVRVTCVFI